MCSNITYATKEKKTCSNVVDCSSMTKLPVLKLVSQELGPNYFYIKIVPKSQYIENYFKKRINPLQTTMYDINVNTKFTI